MNGGRSTHRRDAKCTRNFNGRPLGSWRYRRRITLKWILKYVVYVGMCWLLVTQDRVW
jgi:hypothetical protein